MQRDRENGSDCRIFVCRTEEDVRACFEVVRQLRPSLAGRTDLVDRWRRQAAVGYRMTALLENGKPIAVIGYRVQESLVHNRHIYVDDLVTDQDARGMRLGGMLLDHAKDIGRANECGKLVLGTGADNLRAQAFYRREGLKATSIGFSIKLE